ncbi:metallophosphoesterase, putative [Geotalea daltonii FRC-32]|uniref:Metallophosphoesterase, putative n=1 Tax=Geotalea daltonii (strain DSM 22248 / JCM 15807 / FRC-32) TaxID=316067 RepID=B9M4R5_GEODF|nr:metallophosphoesterase [Geotalea daltonii]ACM21599.1 metallophosphoesterase, putative [Geotalea daltonii FRC-32]
MRKKVLFRTGLFALSLLMVIQFTSGTPGGATKAAPWKFAVLCDNRSNPCVPGGGVQGVNVEVLGKMAAEVAAEKVDVVLVPGDIALGNGYTCTPPTPPPNPADQQYQLWRQTMKPVYDSGAKVLPVRGNHEMDKDAVLSDWSSCRKRVPIESKLLDAYRSVFNDPYLKKISPDSQKGLTYALPHKNALFIGFDQITDQFQVDQKWFDRVLAKNKREHLFVFGHYPAFAVKHKDCLACYGAARDRFWNAIGNAGGRLYFCGHDHFYDRAIIPDAKGRLLQQVLVGNGGAPFASTTAPYADPRVEPAEHIENAYGYMVVTVDGDSVSAKLKVLDLPSGTWRNADAFCYAQRRTAGK